MSPLRSIALVALGVSFLARPVSTAPVTIGFDALAEGEMS
jgi:hypothetical protein